MFLNSQSGLINKATEKECGIYLRGIMIMNTICDHKCLQKLTKFSCEFIIYKSVEDSCANAKHCTIMILQYIFFQEFQSSSIVDRNISPEWLS